MTLSPPSETTSGVLPPGPWCARFVLGFWAAMSVASLVFVARFALTSPFADEWCWVDALCGARQVDASWLLEAENQHRKPLAKLLYLAVGRASGYDFRAGAMVNMAILVLVSLALLCAARRIRGRWSETDILLPIVLMHWGHAINLVWQYELPFVLAPAFSCWILLLIVFSPGAVPVGAALAASAILTAMVGFGGTNASYVPALTMWIVYGAWLQVRCGSPGRYRRGAILTLLAAIPVGAVLLCLWNTDPPPGPVGGTPGFHHDPPLIGALQVLSISVGRLGRVLWPVSGIAIALLILVALGILAKVWRRTPEERARSAGLALVIASVATMALAIGLMRSHLGPRYCLEERYMALAAPLVVALYFVGVCYGPPLRNARLRIALAIVLVGITASYGRNGLHHAQDYRQKIDRLEAMAHDGLSSAAIAARCHVDMQGDAPWLATRLELLRQKGIGPFRNGPPTITQDATVVPVVREVPGGAACRWTPIDSDARFEQPLTPLGEGPLYRIDLRVRDQVRSRSRAAAFAWAIDQVGPGLQRRTLRHGVWREESGRDPLYATLAMEPLRVPSGASLTLVLRPDRRPLVLPLYEGEIAGKKKHFLECFLFFQPPGPRM